ncbi:integrase [Nonomuraea sp. NPDC050691]
MFTTGWASPFTPTRLGHADPSIILRVYAHVIRAAEASAADIFAEAIGE